MRSATTGAEASSWSVTLRGAEAPLFHGAAHGERCAARQRCCLRHDGRMARSCKVRGGASGQRVPRLRKIIRFADDLAALGMTNTIAMG